MIQRLFAVGLSLQSMASNPTVDLNRERLTKTIADVDDTIRQVRTSIFELGSDGMGQGARDQVLALLRELRPVVGSEITASFDGPIDTALPDAVRENLVAVIREAVTNVGRHAGASATSVAIDLSDGCCRLVVTDNGCGFSPTEQVSGGLGLGNLRRRAEKLHGQLTIEHPDAGGTELIWRVPLTQ